MSQHPTVVHWAADHHRAALLADVASDRRTTPVNSGKSGSANVARALATSLAAVVSRIVDEFEPAPGSCPASARQLKAWMRS